MKLIRNEKATPYTMNSNLFCSECANSGKIEEPIEEDREKCDRLQEMFEDTGMNENSYGCRQRALARVRTIAYACPCCEKGMKYKEKYPSIVF